MKVNKKHEDSIKKRYITKVLANVISGFIGIILIAIVPKALGPVVYGQFIYLQEFFSKIIGFLDMGSSTSFFTKLSANHNRKELITFYFIYTLFVLVFLFFFIYLIDYSGYTKLILPNIPNEYIYMGILFGFLTWFTQFLINISDAYALTVSVELIKIGHKIFSLLLLCYYIYKTVFDLESYFYFHYIALLSFIFILSWLFVKKNILDRKLLTLNFGFINLSKEFITYCSPLVITSIISVIVGLFDIWLLQTMAGSLQIGFYGLAYSLAAMSAIFTSAMTPIITREFSKYYAIKDLDMIRHLFLRYLPMLYSISVYFAVFISFQSENLLYIFTDEKFKDAYLVLIIMSFYPILQTYGQLNTGIFYATGKTKLIRNISFVSQPIGILLSFLFIYLLEYEAVGLAIKIVLGAAIGVTIQLYINVKFLNLKMKYFVYHQLFSLLFFIFIMYITDSIMVSMDSKLIEFLLSGMIYTVFVIIGTLIVPSVFGVTREEIFTLIKHMKINRVK